MWIPVAEGWFWWLLPPQTCYLTAAPIMSPQAMPSNKNAASCPHIPPSIRISPALSFQPPQPFSILPLDELCREVEISLSDIVEQAASSKRAAKEAVSAAAAAAVTAAAAEAAAAAAAAMGTGAAAGSASSSGDDGGEGMRQPAAAPAPATANAVAPLLPGALGRASLSRDLVPAADRLSADAIFNSLDDGDY